MNYYIQGDAANADKIKAEFEKRGYDVTGFDMCNDNILFFTYELEGGCKVISTTNANLYTANIIKTHPDYQELPVEPLFKVGDWIVQNDNGTVSQITKVINDTDEYGEYHAYEHTNGYFAACFENEFHLWSTADAKDGDVLAASDGSIFIYADSDDGGCKHHMALAITGSIVINEGLVSHWETASAVKPATKEQRDLIFAKMKEAGYQWDADKKELRKIQPHYDIANFHIGMPVLVREYDTCVWQWVQYSHFNGVGLFFAAGKTWRQCIPFNDDTKHLLGTMGMPSEEYINW